MRGKLLAPDNRGQYMKYAFGEIILVVLGILIALQIDNWNEQRLEDAIEIKYLKNIKIDLEKDISNLDFNIEYRAAKAIGTQKIIDQINGEPIDNLDETTSNVLNTLNQETFQPSNVTYNDLVSSGNMNLISNDSIKIYLFELSLLYQRNTFGIAHETHEYEEYISKPIYKNIDIELMKPVFLGTKTCQEMGITVEDFTSLFSNKEYKNGCVVSIWMSEQMSQVYKETKVLSHRVINLINKDLNL